MSQSISEYIESIIKAGAYFSIAGIDQIRELQVRIRRIFNKSLSVDALALYSKREKENGEITSHEQRGFYQILDDYSTIIDLLVRIKFKNALLKITKPIVIFLAVLIMALLALAVSDRITKIFILVPFLSRPLVLSNFFYFIVACFMVGLCVSVYCKTRGDLHLDKINLILMEYDPSGEITQSKITINLTSKGNQDIEESKKQL